MEEVAQKLDEILDLFQRPHIIFKPEIKEWKGKWKAIYGSVEAIGETPMDACYKFDSVFWDGK
ncbi:MAG: hypothetical protein DWP97_03730 [Calditrichaeota bacterium]|nr:MAG: hypothetical protein DWP97_03730 [Calditrichota bacterium]